MRGRSPVPFQRSFVSRVGGLMLAALLATPALAQPLRFEQATEPLSAALVREAVVGDAAAAFDRALQLGRAQDEVFATDLRRRRDGLAARSDVHGRARSVTASTTTYFGGCLSHEYRVRYADTAQTWTLKWRRGPQGWYLADLVVRGPAI